MATDADIAELRRKTDITDTDEPYTDPFLSGLIDREGTVDGASYVLWRDKAAKLAELVNVTEGASSRQMGQAFDHALEMVKLYERVSKVDVVTEQAPFTIEMTR